MINGASTRLMYESLGPTRFVPQWRQLLGLQPVGQQIKRDPETGKPVLESREVRPNEVSVRELADAIIGPNAADILGQPRHVLEAGGAVVPSAFANISAFNSSVAGLLEAKILEVWNRPEFLAEQLMEHIPSRKRSEKFIGISSIGDDALTRKPGNPHARAQVSERYVTTPDTTNTALGMDITREAVMFDETTQLLQQAEEVATAVRLRKEYRCLDVFLGVTNTYTYNGTTYNTYVASAGNWVNLHQNALVDWTDIDNALQLFVNMTDQETGQPVQVIPKDIFVMPFNYMLAAQILNATAVEKRTDTAANVAIGGNPLRAVGQLNVLGSATYPYAYKRALAADGLNFAEANAKGVWFIGDFKKAFVYVENLPLLVKRVDANDYQMADNGLVLSVFVDECGVPAVREPRCVVRNQVQAP